MERLRQELTIQNSTQPTWSPPMKTDVKRKSLDVGAIKRLSDKMFDFMLVTREAENKDILLNEASTLNK